MSEDDELSRGWKVAPYAVALVPYGAWLVVVGSSILYYAWRKDHPQRAAAINLHGWLAWLFGLALWGLVWFLQTS